MRGGINLFIKGLIVASTLAICMLLLPTKVEAAAPAAHVVVALKLIQNGKIRVSPKDIPAFLHHRASRRGNRTRTLDELRYRCEGAWRLPLLRGRKRWRGICHNASGGSAVMRPRRRFGICCPAMPMDRKRDAECDAMDRRR